MPGKQKIESEDDDSSQDEYQNDGFVVDSGEDEVDEDQQINSGDEEYNEEPLSDDDLDLLEENKNKTKVRRLLKQEESEQNEIEEEVSEPTSIVDEVDQNELINRLFDPTQRDMLSQTDEDIVRLDVPERIQLNYLKANQKLLKEFREEPTESHIRWVAERLFKERQFHASEQTDVLKGVKLILESYRKENFEMMYIFTYKEHLITKQLKLDDYWRIQELDFEYETFQKFQHKLIELISTLPDGPHMQTLQLAIQNCYYLNDLKNLREYAMYILLKAKCKARTSGSLEEETQYLSLTEQKSAKKEKLLLELMKNNIDQIYNQLGLTTDEYFDVLLGKTPPITRQLFRSKEELMATQTQDLISQIKKYLTIELYHHPIIRQNVYKYYQELVLVSTEPTPLGNKEINALSYLYPVKRIQGRSIRFLEDQMFLMALKAEEQGFIKIIFTVSSELESKGSKVLKKDDLMMKLADKFANIGPEFSKLKDLRESILCSVLLEFWYPSLQKQVRAQLKASATKHVLALCANSFKSLINQSNDQNKEKRIMSLVLASDTNNSQSLKSYTMDYSIQKKHIAMAIVDHKGQHIHLHIFNYLTADERRPDLADLIAKEKSLFEQIFESYKPDVIVLSGNSQECYRLRADLRNDKKFRFSSVSFFATLMDPTVSHIYSLSDKSAQQLPDIPPILREAISLARYRINPLAEVLNIWDKNPEKNGCLHLQLHPLQGMVSQLELQEALELVAIEIVNSVGVDLVDSTLYNHLQSLMQFVTGLGPRKAKHLIQMFKSILSDKLCSNNFESEKKLIQRLAEIPKQDYLQISRGDILKTQTLGKTVFKNMQGFVKIINGIQPLDSTRLLMKMYQDASYISKNAMDVQGKDDKYNTVVRQLMENPQKLEDLELEAWAIQKEQSEGTENYLKVVNFIRRELKVPFLHTYESKEREMSDPEIFYAVTQESEITFRKNTIVSGPVIRIYENELLIKISDNGLTGGLQKNDMTREFQIGQVVKAYVSNIPAITPRDQKKTPANLFKVELSLKPDWNDHKLLQRLITGPKPAVWFYNFDFETYEEKVKHTFDRDKKDQDLPIIQQPIQVKQKLILRNINHPKFKQVLLKGALDYIQSQPIGEYLIRPSTKSRELLIITWKFYENCIAHLAVQEQQVQGSYKPQLFLNGQKYDSFDEIYERYIVPCNLHMEAIVQNKKFINGSMDYLDSKLREEKEKAEDIIPYGFCVTEKAPQYVVLMYMKEKTKVEKEFIKVKPDGLSFHQIMHINLKELIIWFKKNFRQPEYKTFVKRTRPPYQETNDRLGQINSQWDIKKEKVKTEVKYEDNYTSSNCTKCGKRGHNANECRNGGDSYRERDKDRGQRGCHQCGKDGHMKKNCPDLNRGNQSYRKRSQSRDREKQNYRMQPKLEEFDY